MGGNHSSAGKNHIYEEITDNQVVRSNSRFDRKESTATLDVRVEDLEKLERKRLEQTSGEWGDEDEGGDHRVGVGGGWCQDMGWGQEEVKKTRTRKRGAISNVTFYENVDSHVFGEDNIAEANNDDFELEKTGEMKTVKYKRCKSIDIKVLDSKNGESIEF